MSENPNADTVLSAQERKAGDDVAMYAVVAARRAQYHNMLWQVPTMSLTAQAFLFTIALGHDSSRG